jgi:hypothetical protein
MEGPALGGVGGLVIDLLALPAADDEPGGPQDLQMVGHGRTAHLHQRRQIDDALLAVAQQPEDLQPAGVIQLFEHVRNGGKFLRSGHFFLSTLKHPAMIMGQAAIAHSPGPPVWA